MACLVEHGKVADLMLKEGKLFWIIPSVSIDYFESATLEDLEGTLSCYPLL